MSDDGCLMTDDGLMGDDCCLEGDDCRPIHHPSVHRRRCRTSACHRGVKWLASETATSWSWN
jgi:hypothetical protein